MLDVEKVINSDNPKGAELSRLWFIRYMNKFNAKGKDVEEIISLKDFLQLCKKLTPEENEIYNSYANIFEWFSNSYNMVKAQELQYMIRVDKLRQALIDIKVAEDIEDYFYNLPVIMTDRQAKELGKHPMKFQSADKLRDEQAEIESNGIAIIPKDCTNENINDTTGYYEIPELPSIVFSMAIDNYFPESPDYEKNKKLIEQHKNLARFSYSYVAAFNTAIDLVAEYYKIPEMLETKCNLDYMDQAVTILNNTQESLFNQIEERLVLPGFQETKEKKLQVIKTTIGKLDVTGLLPTEKNKKKVISYFRNFEIFKNTELNLIAILRGNNYA